MDRVVVQEETGFVRGRLSSVALIHFNETSEVSGHLRVSTMTGIPYFRFSDSPIYVRIRGSFTTPDEITSLPLVRNHRTT